jgi:cell division protein FtsB
MSLRSVRPGSWMLGLTAAAAAVLGLGMMRGESSVHSYFELHKSRDVLQQTVTSLEKENAAISEEIVRLKKSPSYARKVLRDKYHVTDEDEDIVFFAD